MNYTLTAAIFSLLTIAPLKAEIIESCGEYTARGIVRAKADGIKLIINEKTLSEYVISMPTLEQAKIAGFIDKDVSVSLILNKKTIGQKLESSEIRSATFRIPDPLNPKDTGFTLIKEVKCVN